LYLEEKLLFDNYEKVTVHTIFENEPAGTALKPGKNLDWEAWGDIAYLRFILTSLSVTLSETEKMSILPLYGPLLPLNFYAEEGDVEGVYSRQDGKACLDIHAGTLVWELL
jgi:hypothetical protein